MTDYTPQQTKEIPLTQGKVAIVDAADYDWLNQWKWYAVKTNTTYYAQRAQSMGGSKQRLVYMHREILGAESGEQVDHKDGNGLNNARANIRSCTRSQNRSNGRPKWPNKEGFRGVTRTPKGDRWKAHIMLNRKNRHLGTFDTPEDAARAYDAAAKELHGEFARLNFE